MHVNFTRRKVNGIHSHSSKENVFSFGFQRKCEIENAFVLFWCSVVSAINSVVVWFSDWVVQKQNEWKRKRMRNAREKFNNTLLFLSQRDLHTGKSHHDDIFYGGRWLMNIDRSRVYKHSANKQTWYRGYVQSKVLQNLLILMAVCYWQQSISHRFCPLTAD